jgi:hypothetical protein
MRGSSVLENSPASPACLDCQSGFIRVLGVLCLASATAEEPKRARACCFSRLESSAVHFERDLLLCDISFDLLK